MEKNNTIYNSFITSVCIYRYLTIYIRVIKLSFTLQSETVLLLLGTIPLISEMITIQVDNNAALNAIKESLKK